MAEHSDQHIYGRHANWRETWRPVLAGPVDGRALFFIIPLFAYLSMFTLVFMGLILTVFWMLQRRKIQPDNVLKWVRSRTLGPHRTARGLTDRRMPMDYGFERMEDYLRAEREAAQWLERARKPVKKSKKKKKGAYSSEDDPAPVLIDEEERERYPFRLYNARLG